MSINLIAVPPGQHRSRVSRRSRRSLPRRRRSTRSRRTARSARLVPLRPPLEARVRRCERYDARLTAESEQIRLNGQRAAIVGYFDLGTGFSWNGMLLSSEETFARFMMRPTDRVNFGLFNSRPGTDPVAVQRELRSTLPPDVKVYTRDEINASERHYWLRLTSIGQFLVVAVILAVFVGIIFVYQMMAADIRNMLPEFATVKALGYRPPYLTGVVLWQAVLLAVLGYLPGFVATLGLYSAARNWGGIPTGMTLEVALGVLVLTSGMCLASGLLAVRKVHSADPADLF